MEVQLRRYRVSSSNQSVHLLQACDGLWDVLEDQEAVNLVLEGIHEARGWDIDGSKVQSILLA